MEGWQQSSIISGVRRPLLQANAIGRSSKTVREFLEKNHKDDMERDETIKLTIKSLLEVVQTGAKNIEISVMERYGVITVRTTNFFDHFPGPDPLIYLTFCSRSIYLKSKVSLRKSNVRRSKVSLSYRDTIISVS